MEKKRREGGMEYGGEQTVLPWSNSSFRCLSLCHTIEVHCTGLERPFFALWCLSSMQCRPWVPFRQEFGHIVQVVHRCCLPFLWNTCWIQLLYAFGNTRVTASVKSYISEHRAQPQRQLWPNIVYRSALVSFCANHRRTLLTCYLAQHSMVHSMTRVETGHPKTDW